MTGADPSQSKPSASSASEPSLAEGAPPYLQTEPRLALKLIFSGGPWQLLRWRLKRQMGGLSSQKAQLFRFPPSSPSAPAAAAPPPPRGFEIAQDVKYRSEITQLRGSALYKQAAKEWREELLELAPDATTTILR
eukprot:1058632-Rhodomonas_salina.1